MSVGEGEEERKKEEEEEEEEGENREGGGSLLLSRRVGGPVREKTDAHVCILSYLEENSSDEGGGTPEAKL